jgi:hypothetical protein
MGLMIHSLGALPANAEKDYYVYLLDYGWHEPLGDALLKNFDNMADAASKSNSVILRGLVGCHFVDEVLSWHSINGQSSEGILPAILITTRNPHEFHRQEISDTGRTTDRLLLIPLRQVCESTGDVAVLIDKIFTDIREKRKLSSFAIGKKLRAGKANAIVDSIVLKPNISGVGIDLNALIDFFRKG